jgi:hypothetical protein
LELKISELKIEKAENIRNCASGNPKFLTFCDAQKISNIELKLEFEVFTRAENIGTENI